MYEPDRDLFEKIALLKCIRCGSTENLMPYNHVRKFNTSSYTGRGMSTTSWERSVVVPACSDCLRGFLDWKRKLTRTNFLCCAMCCLLGIGIIGSWSLSSMLHLDNMISLAISAVLGWGGMILICVFLKRSRKAYRALNESDINPINYVDLTSTGEVYIISRETQEKVPYTRWIQYTLKDRIDNQFASAPTCPSCGTEVQSNESFCGFCGFQLRL